MRYRVVTVASVSSVTGPGPSTLQAALDEIEPGERLHSVVTIHDFHGGTRNLLAVFEREGDT